ncbi:MAG: NAD-dependent epimerase/dehydratase family protein [Fimbriimonadaceae bacterium]
MKIAITGGTGFVGRHLAKRLVQLGHEVVLISRGVDKREPTDMQVCAIGLNNIVELTEALQGCDAVAHLAGINREIGSQTYANVHVQGTANVLQAAQVAGAKKVILLSFLRARPECGSLYHESKWEAEELVRNFGLDYTIFKAGVIYGKGDHMLDHISHALHTFPAFLLVGFKKLTMRPLAIDDLTAVMVKSLTEGKLSRACVPITGPEELTLREVACRISAVIGRRPIIFPVPVWVHYAMAWVFERTMAIPLAAKAQVRILSESMSEPLKACDELPHDLLPQTRFTEVQIKLGLPEPGRFGLKDCLRRSVRLNP